MLKLNRSAFAAVAPCPLFSIDAEIPKLDVAGSTPGSTPVSRSIVFNNLEIVHVYPGACISRNFLEDVSYLSRYGCRVHRDTAASLPNLP